MNKKNMVLKSLKSVIKESLNFIVSLPYRFACPIKTVGVNCLIYKCSSNNKMGEIILGDHVTLRNCEFYFEGSVPSNNAIIVGSNSRVEGVKFIQRYGGVNVIEIGPHSTFGGEVQIEASEGSKVIVGEDCMFAHRIHITTTDHHSILYNDGTRCNKAQNILIGNHVWVGMGVTILKGGIIPDGSIVGANSTYTAKNSDDKNSIFVGTPAKIVRCNISWNRELI